MMKEALKAEATGEYAEQIKKLESDMWSLSKDVELLAWISDQMFISPFSYKCETANERLALIGPTLLSLVNGRCRELSDRFEALNKGGVRR